jgi:membrane-bound serine protease (ClpP class)
MYRFAFIALIFISVVSWSSTNAQTVYTITVDGAISPASSDYIHEAIITANEANAQCLIIFLNTPGGLLKSTRMIVSDFLGAPIPVIVYVAPGGAQAASAGVFITLAAHIAVMAPGTNIGAAHPVTLGDQQDSIMLEKTTNDAAAFIRTISDKRNRNVKWAEDAVRKSISITETEALRENVIDTIAANLNELLTMIHGTTVETSRGTTILQTREASIVTIEKSFQQKILEILSDPNIAYILLMLGIYGLLFELYNPGAILPGIVGFICLVLAFYSMHTLPINYAGLALILFAIVLFILEIKVVSHGLLTIGGVVALALGSIMLIQKESFLEFAVISWEIIVTTIVLTVLFFAFAIGMGIKAQRKKPTTGMQGIIGETGEAMSDLRPEGSVKIHGEIWNAVSLDGVIKRGTKITVAEADKLVLKVHKVHS